MSRTLAWLLVLVAVIATTVAASAVDIDDEMRAPAARDQQWMQQAADDIGLVEVRTQTRRGSKEEGRERADLAAARIEACSGLIPASLRSSLTFFFFFSLFFSSSAVRCIGGAG